MVHPVLFDPVWSNSVLLGPSCPLWSYSVLFNPLWSYSFMFCPLQSYLVHLFTLVLFSPIQSTLVLLGPLSSNLVLFNSLWFYSVHFSRIWSILSTLVLFGNFSPYSPLWSYLVIFNLLWSNSVLFGLFYSLFLLKKKNIYIYISKSFSKHEEYEYTNVFIRPRYQSIFGVGSY